MKTIQDHFWRDKLPTWNLGEALIPLILNHLGYEGITKRRPDCSTLLMIGSELRESFVRGLGSPAVVWGYGWSHGAAPPQVDVRAVRGPVTHKVLNLPNDLPMGDPGFLISKANPVNRRPTPGRVLYAPHWNNRKLARPEPGESIFNVELEAASMTAIREKLATLNSAEFVLTSSLHVAICCISYRIPFGLVRRGEEKIDKPAKWRDVFRWLNATHEFVETEAEARDWWNTVGSQIIVPPLDPLLATFPHDIAL